MPTKEEILEYSQKIERIAIDEGFTLMDSVLHDCNETEMEVEVASTLLSSALKARIRDEAQELNLLKKNSKLPI